MRAGTTWKKLVHDSETISYIKDVEGYRIIIEARQFEDNWEIVKKYIGAGINFTETYSAQNHQELRHLLKHLRSEKELSRKEIQGINEFKKKSLRVMVRRGWKEENAEKWYFSIDDNFNNYIIVHYGKTVDIDIVMEEQLKHIEEKMIAKLYDVLGLQENDLPINQNMYYYSKKSYYYVESEAEGMDFEFVFD